jgi:two-component system NtrC family sensor kinase
LKLFYKLALVLLLVAAVPLALSGWAATRITEGAMVGKIEELHLKSAQEMARNIEGTLHKLIRELQMQLGYLRFAEFNPEEMEGGLSVIYLQHDAINVVSLLDEHGESPAGVAAKYMSDIQDHDERYRNHAEMTLEELEEFARHIPFAEAQAQGTAVGKVYVSLRKRMALLPVAIAFPGPAGQRWVLALELSLDPIQDLVGSRSWGSQGGAFLVDAQGTLIAHSDMKRVLARESLTPLRIVAGALEEQSGASGVARYVEDGAQMLGAFARLPSLGWVVVFYHPLSAALVSVEAVLHQTLFWIGASVVLAAALAFFFARGISSPVNLIADGARRFGRGDFEQPIRVSARDEIGLLAEAFNAMGADLKRSLAQIAEQNRELEAWNRELMVRVEERTRELREAQDQLLVSQKLAAVGELGAGVAHEINNPLAGVLGVTQLLLKKIPPDDPTHRSLKAVEKEALKMREIVQNLLRFSQPLEGSVFTPVQIQAVCDQALFMLETRLCEQGIEVVRQYGTDVPRILGDPSQLQQVLLHLLNNARAAMPGGGRLTLQTDHLEHRVVRLKVSDTGRGISREHLDKIFEPFFTTKAEWSGKGLGLSVAYRIVQEHHGKMTVESELGRGTTFTLTFPALPPKTHLV